MRRLTLEEFIERARAVHGERYDYSQVVYTVVAERITVVCPQHGPFKPVAKNHLYQKLGCPCCALETRTEKTRRLTTEMFIERARAIHGDRYDYSQSEYHKAELPLTVICPTHGPFTTSHLYHVLRRKGCPRCGRERGARARQKVKD